ncbi:MAG: hypothetical protein WC130_03750 [Kiritimatiellia bacterium]
MSKKKNVMQVKKIIAVAGRDKRMEYASQWRARLDALSGRKKDSLSISAFCQRYGIDRPLLYRISWGERVPEWESILKVEVALAAEGV